MVNKTGLQSASTPVEKGSVHICRQYPFKDRPPMFEMLKHQQVQTVVSIGRLTAFYVVSYKGFSSVQFLFDCCGCGCGWGRRQAIILFWPCGHAAKILLKTAAAVTKNCPTPNSHPARKVLGWGGVEFVASRPCSVIPCSVDKK